MAQKHLLRVSDETPQDDESYSTSRYAAAQRWRKLLVWARVALVLAALSVAGVFVYRQVRLTAIDDALAASSEGEAAEALAAADLSEPFYLLLAGVPFDPDAETQLGTVPDKIDLVRVDPRGKKLTIVAISGATAFEMDEYGTRKIEDAYELGGIAYLVNVVSRFAGVPIAHYAAGDIDAFGNITHELLGASSTSDLELLARVPRVVASDLTGRDYEKLAHELRGLDFTVDVWRASNPTESAHVAGDDWEVSLAQEWRLMMQRIDAGLAPEEPAVSTGQGDEAPAEQGSEQGSAPFDFSGTVLVLNGSNVSGVAATAASTLERVGYEVGIGNTENRYSASYVLYDDPANEKKAESVNATLGGGLQVMANDTGHALEADVVVILGADRGAGM